MLNLSDENKCFFNKWCTKCSLIVASPALATTHLLAASVVQLWVGARSLLRDLLLDTRLFRSVFMDMVSWVFLMVSLPCTMTAMVARHTSNLT